MPDDSHHRISAEGADPLLFAGVNDANLLELQRTLGVRVSFRGDTVNLTGTTDQLDRATPVVHGLLKYGYAVQSERIALRWIVTTLVLNTAGAGAYAVKVSWAVPGRDV
jgi:phosphate starvation-inducible protein PhoH